MSGGALPLSLQETARKARFGHRDWIHWTSRDGLPQAERASRESVKRALLDIGTAGRFLIVGASTGVAHLHRFPDGCRMMRNARHLWGR